MKNLSILKRKTGLYSKSLKLLFLLLILTVSFACKKKPISTNEPEPVPTDQHGEVIGEPIKQTIGVTGGTITTPDANVKLVVPEGALKSDVNISIQEVKSTLGIISVGKTYRLLPENIQFEKDVDLTLSFTNRDLNGTNRELLYLAYQDKDGKWHKAGKSTYSSFSNEVSVKTKHFSDWTVWASAKIILEGKNELFAKEITKASVVYVEPPTDPNSDDDLLAPVEPDPTGLVKNWGSIMPEWGYLTADGDKATFKAPDLITTGMTGSSVGMVAYLDVSKLGSGPGRPQQYPPYGIIQKVLLFADEYLVWDKSDYVGFRARAETLEKTLNGNSLDLKGRFNAGDARYEQTFHISNPTSANGEYFFGTVQGSYVRWYDAGYNYSSLYTCNSEEKNTIGSILITTKDGYIEGRVGGTLQWTSRPCNVSETQAVYARFRVKKE